MGYSKSPSIYSIWEYLNPMLLNINAKLNALQEWWWAVLLMGVGFIILMGLFIKCCAVHTPSSNPKKTPARRIGDTLRRPINTLRRHVRIIFLLLEYFL